MDELLIGLIVLLFKLLFRGLRGVLRLVGRGVGAVGRAQSGQGGASAQRAAPATGQTQQRRPPARPEAASISTVMGPRTLALSSRLDAIARRAAQEAERCASEEANERFARTLEEYVVPSTIAAKKRLSAQGEAAALQLGGAAAYLEVVVSLVESLARQRRDEELSLLVGDSDALAEAVYRPVIDYARADGIRLAHDEVATLLGEDDLAALVGIIPSGLVPIVLPPDWGIEIAWWPALAHEVGHSLYRSLAFDGELRRRWQLPRAGDIPAGRSVSAQHLLGAWLEEMFADAFGVMMLGPAFVRTMLWTFASTDDPRRVVTVATDGRGAQLDEHPPGHLRVLLGCRLLEEMGYPREAEALEREWRKKHGDALERFYIPARGNTWFTVDEGALVAAVVERTRAFYNEPFAVLGGEPLRSLPGLDYGPREHQAALAVAAHVAAGGVAPTRDPRSLIAGAVLAWAQRPSSGGIILRAARATIPAIGVSFRRRRLREEAAQAASLDAVGQDLLVEAVLADAILGPPPSLRAR